jgi:hypothetical protein
MPRGYRSDDAPERPRRDDPPVRIEGCRGLAKTPKALLVYNMRWGKNRWVPQSVIHADSEVYEVGNETGVLVVAAWWAKKEGLVR